MIILSQDKETIINFNNVKEIMVDGNAITITDNIYKNYGEIIGEYKTEERAKEILKQIIGKYQQYFENRNREIVMIPKVYEMPKE